jgi:hypothetical protein
MELFRLLFFIIIPALNRSRSGAIACAGAACSTVASLPGNEHERLATVVAMMLKSIYPHYFRPDEEAGN